MFGPFGPNIVSFVWISTLLLFYVEGYYSLSFNAIDFKPWHKDPYILGRCDMTFLSHTSCSSGFFSGFSGSLCESMLVHLCTCWQKPVNESWPVNIEAHCQRRHDLLEPFENPIY